METLKEKQKLYDNITDNMVKIKELGKSEDGNTGYSELQMLCGRVEQAIKLSVPPLNGKQSSGDIVVLFQQANEIKDRFFELRFSLLVLSSLFSMTLSTRF